MSIFIERPRRAVLPVILAVGLMLSACTDGGEQPNPVQPTVSVPPKPNVPKQQAEDSKAEEKADSDGLKRITKALSAFDTAEDAICNASFAAVKHGKAIVTETQSDSQWHKRWDVAAPIGASGLAHLAYKEKSHLGRAERQGESDTYDCLSTDIRLLSFENAADRQSFKDGGKVDYNEFTIVDSPMTGIDASLKVHLQTVVDPWYASKVNVPSLDQATHEYDPSEYRPSELKDAQYMVDEFQAALA